MSGLNQRNRTSRRYITYIYVKLTHVILEAGKSQDLGGESSSWRPRRADVFISFWVPRPENQRASVGVPVQRLAGSRHRKSQCFSSSLQAGKTGVPIQKQSSKRNSPLLGENFLLDSGLQLIGCSSPILGRAVCLSVAATAAKSLQPCPTLCDPIDSSPPGSSLPGILQARILEWVAISFSNSCMHAKLLQSCPTLCGPMDSSPPGSPVHGILQARIQE